MAVFKVTNFGGEVPRLPPRALPGDAAQANQNLLATAAEFRPLQGDKDVDAAEPGALALYRLSRNADGTLRTGDTDGWVTDALDKNFVRGQLNDDATERTVVSFNDGSAPPRVIDARGQDRLLGVPPPASIAVSRNEGEYFSGAEALEWIDETLLPAVVKALKDSLHEDTIESRYDGGKPVAGASSFFGMVVRPSKAKPWLVYYQIPSVAEAKSRGLNAVELGGDVGGDGKYNLPLELMPYWGRVKNTAALKARLRDIEHPVEGTQIFTDAQIDELADKLIALFDPDGPSLKAQRQQMDKAAEDFKAAVENAPQGRGPRPVEPTKPTVPEYIVEPDFGDSDRRLKQDIVAVGRDDATGLTLYEFSYKAMPSQRWVGVMADEVRAARPDAVRRVNGFDQVNYGALGIQLRRL